MSRKRKRSPDQPAIQPIDPIDPIDPIEIETIETIDPFEQLPYDPFEQLPADQTDQDQPTTRLTVEMALWILIAVVALVLRLARLDAAPLNSSEAREATLAWRAATGQGMPGSGYSPLLFSANALLFALGGASDSLARLWPVLCGSGLALTPFLLRRRIGRMGALAAGAYLAFSPIALFASRQLDGAIVAALGVMLFLGGLIYFFDGVAEDNNDTVQDNADVVEDNADAVEKAPDTDRRIWLTLSAGGLALAVVSSSSAFGLLLPLGLAWLSLAWVRSENQMQRLWKAFSPHLNYALMAFLLGALALSTALGWNLGGLGAVGDLLPAWIARFGPASNALPSPFTLLTVYELLALLFGFGGLVWAVLHKHRFGSVVGAWAAAGTLLLLVMPGRTRLDTLWLLLPLVLLAGIALEQLVQGLWERGDRFSEGLHIPVVIFLWIRLYLALAGYAVTDSTADLVLAMLTIAMQLLLALVFALALKFDAALRSVAVGTGIVALAVVISAGWGVAYVRPSDPREPLVHEPTAIEVRDLVQTLRDLSWRETGLPLTLPFTLEAAPDSVLAWYLRDFEAARPFRESGTEAIDTVLVTPRLDLWPVDDGVERIGQGFALRRTWDLETITCAWEWPRRNWNQEAEQYLWDWPLYCRPAVAWWLFRDSSAVPTTLVDRQVVLWSVESESD